ncbi:MAG: hypothetical protein QOK68_04730 [Nitrososphaeraceae archaeon]|nr:hypothetical protein [Nitrososphaeraceae archaeon]
MLTIQNIMKIGNVLYSYMSTTNMTELERQEEKIKLDSIAGKPQHIEINERSLVAYREAFAKKILVIQKHKDYPKEDFFYYKKAKEV